MSAAVQNAGIALSLSIGQRVRHRDFDGKRVTGVIRGLSVDTDRVLMAHFVLDAAIVIPAINEGDREISIWHQHVPAHELAAFDDRDELIAEMLAALQAEQEWREREDAGAIDPEWDYELMVGTKRRAAIAKATGEEGGASHG